jgi:sugar lactone lactonase YvrE
VKEAQVAGLPRVLVGGLGYPEGLRWHDDHLYFSDFVTRRVQRTDVTGRGETVAIVLGQPSGLGFSPDGMLVAVSMFDNTLIRVEDDGSVALLADLRDGARGPSNDLLVDDRGNCYVGSFGYNVWYEPQAAVRSAPLCLVAPDAGVTVVAEDMLFPNGMAMILPQRTLLVAETFANRITAFDVAADGSLSGRRVFADLGGRAPDGICLTPEGQVWVACPLQQEAALVEEGGEVADVIRFPGRMPTDCVVGGSDGDLLFVGTSGQNTMRDGSTVGTIEVVTRSPQ